MKTFGEESGRYEDQEGNGRITLSRILGN